MPKGEMRGNSVPGNKSLEETLQTAELFQMEAAQHQLYQEQVMVLNLQGVMDRNEMIPTSGSSFKTNTQNPKGSCVAPDFRISWVVSEMIMAEGPDPRRARYTQTPEEIPQRTVKRKRR